MEDLIADEDVVLTVTRGGYAKRTPLSVYREQKRGGQGAHGRRRRRRRTSSSTSSSPRRTTTSSSSRTGGASTG